ncbi:3'-5' exonuclease [Vogesella facilis]|uniref:DNA 3'-5' helicase n=1 Tax=Vogesella facilis TaxID=1655232 RepID=A0ABV7RFE2_9NEIS
MFINLFEKVWAAWEAKLKRDQCIDYDDMLVLAADCVEKQQEESHYQLVMVDEFQDASQARARLIASLLNGPGKCLFAVGDDWQSINRFAGADLAVMTDFEKKFGRAVTLKLETTFRCPQSLCDISSTFVQKNPKQIKKKVRSSKPNVTDPVRIIQVEDENQIRSAVGKRINEISAESPSKGKKIRIYILGRYNKEKIYVPLDYDTSQIEVEFVTVHSSKGLEADHIIIPRVTAETLGFPSRIEDDPVLQLAMPGGDSYEYAEERRLFYVALTRARSSVTLVTLAHKASSFIAELVKDHKLDVYSIDGNEANSELCPVCRDGFLVKKNGRFGLFYGCSRFPRCRHTQKINKS